MKKRVAATALWALVGWSGGSLITGIFGVPGAIALIPAILMPALVLLDPTGMMWSRSGTGKRIRRPIEELAAELDQKAAAAAMSTREQRSTR